jgi:23S rRNA pseudouridine1911/1915/1917 synthase
LIKAGRVRVDAEPVTKPAFELQGGETIKATIPAPAPSHLEPDPIPLDILFEDDRILVVNKPAGMVVHPGAGHKRGTLVQAVLAHAPDIRGVGGQKRPGLVHRLDMDTSGVIVLAKDDQAHQALQAQFKARAVGKEYLALVEGQPPSSSGRIEAPIGRDRRHRQRMAVVTDDSGRPAVSVFHVEQSLADHTLLLLKPESGRTHQIRVHLAFIGCPVLGDDVYGGRGQSTLAKRQLLHAYKLQLTPPGSPAPVTYRAPLAPDFARALEQLGGNSQPYL